MSIRNRGDYALRAVYINGPDALHAYYDVYERGADRVWEGRLETAAVRYMVLPPDESQLRELIRTIRGSDSADAAIRVVGIARAAEASGALVERFQKHPRSPARTSPERLSSTNQSHPPG